MYLSSSFYSHSSRNSSNSSNTTTHWQAYSANSPTCAYPSWPRRSSLNSANEDNGSNLSYGHTSSFITDEELLATSFRPSNHQPNYNSCRSPASLSQCELSTEPQLSPCQVAKDSARNLVRELLELEKLKRSKRRKNSSASKKSRSSSGSSKYMTPIIEWVRYMGDKTTSPNLIMHIRIKFNSARSHAPPPTLAHAITRIKFDVCSRINVTIKVATSLNCKTINIISLIRLINPH